MNTPHRRAIIHFNDGSHLALEWPKQEMPGQIFLSEALRKAIEARQLLVEVEGNLLVIQMANLNYIELQPAPDDLPDGAIRGAHRVASLAAH